MMDKFRKFGATRYSRAMLYLLIASFAAWGIGDYLTNSFGAEAITVNGEKISPADVETTYNQRLENIAQLIGNKPTAEQIEQMQLPEQVIAEVVARTVLRQTAEKMHFQPATRQLQDEISRISAFKNEKGQFDSARYNQILQQIGRTAKQFEHDLGQDITVRQLARLARVETPSQNLAALMTSAENAQLTLEVATLSPASAGNIPAPTEQELAAFHAGNAGLYSRPETRDMVVLRLNRADLAKTITVSDKDIETAYNDNKAAYALPEQRTVRHILLEKKEDADKIAATIKTLQDFEKAANEFTKDPGNNNRGGLLGNIQKKDVVPAFGNAAFALPVATLSPPVKSNFGWHLIWVDSIEPSKTLSFEEMKEPIAKDFATNQAAEALERLTAQVDDKIAAKESLAKIATDLGLKTIQHNAVNAKDEAVEPNELQAAFNLQKNEISVPITTGEGGTTYVQTTDITPAKTLPLAEIKDRVIKDWKNAAIQRALQQNADKLLGLARDPATKTTLAQTAATAGIAVQTSSLELKKADEAPTWLQRHLLSIYPMALGNTLGATLQDGENWHIVRLAARTESPIPADELPENAKIYQQRMQGDVEALLMTYLTQQARVKLNQPQLKSLFGREIAWDTPATN